MPGLLRRWRQWSGIAALAITVALVACESVPSPPLMSPIQFAKYYGYSDIPLDDDRYQVTYVAPTQRSLSSPASQQAANAAARAQAFDFALWRAAQIAVERGLSGFRVSNVRSNVNTVLNEDYGASPWYGPGFYPYRRYPWGPYWGPPYWGPSPYAYQQAEVTMDVQLLRSPGPGDYKAEEVIARLRRTYPGAEGPLGGAAPTDQAPAGQS